ncbi:MAG: hypothetical protein ACTHXA_08490 [Gulosibacter sp.]|uniref:hypothetical protein n=1 Tax=Gulosibacter sp. TaxID=2817531 RepID=UPI003F8E7788
MSEFHVDSACTLIEHLDESGLDPREMSMESADLWEFSAIHELLAAASYEDDQYEAWYEEAKAMRTAFSMFELELMEEHFEALASRCVERE